jgi:hypothetical protein
MKAVIMRFLQLSLLKYEYNYINICLNARRIFESWEAKGWSREIQEIENQVIMNPVEFLS